MLRLRLFREGDLSNQLDSRVLDEGELRIGRDPKADWPVPGAGRDISREHLVLTGRGGMATLRDASSNGTFMGQPRQRIESGREVPVGPGDVIAFGPFVLVLEQAGEGETRPSATPASDVSPFDAPQGIDAPLAPSRRAQPFASEMRVDPFDQVAAADEGGDAWERRPAEEAGSWHASAARHRPEPTQLIGAERAWRVPPAPAPGEAGFGFDAPFSRPILEQPSVTADAAQIPSDWLEAAAGQEEGPPPEPVAPRQDAPSAPPPEPVREAGDDRLFDHFCAGAGLSPHAFAGEDRAQLMEQLGATYRQAVLGIADLMQERTSVRNEYRMLRTSVRPEGNNPFKWVPPQRIASELLRAEGSGYTTGARALNDALFDIKAHLLCMLAGMRAALAATFDQLSPETVERRLRNRTFMMKSQHDAAAWADYVELAKQLRADTDESVDGAINRAFREGYEAQLDALGGGGRG